MIQLRSYIVIFMLLLSVAAPATAEIFKWTDEQGKVHFTDSPPKDQRVEQVEVKVNTYTAVEITPVVERLGRKDKVVMYSAAWCGICKKAKRYFQKKNISYIAYDIEKSRSGKRGYKLLKGKGVPIIIVGDKRMNGFNVTKFEKFYAQQMEKNTPAMNPAEGV